MIIDNFAGGGGASTGIEMALERSPDVAVNHDAAAIAVHRANHPWTRHYASDVFEIDPVVASRNQPVGLAWFSPDCTHHSKARGGKPFRHPDRAKRIRGLAWVVVRWAELPEHSRPRVIVLENVEEFEDWGPLDGNRPCPRRKGQTFQRFVRRLRALGYTVEWRQLRACNYGSPTIRRRLFLIARCDGKRIRWPQPTHGRPGSEAVESGRLKPWRAAAEIIDWSLPCPSIFLTREAAKLLNVRRPLAENTMRRIAAGLKRYVLEAEEPFLVLCNHGGSEFRGQSAADPVSTLTASRDALGLVMPYGTTYYGPKNGDHHRGVHLSEPLRTLSTENRFGLVTPSVISVAHGDSGGRRAYHPGEPLGTLTQYRQFALSAPFIGRHFGNSIGHSVEYPLGTVTAGGGGKSQLVSAWMAQHNRGTVGHSAGAPLSTLTMKGCQQTMVAACLSHQYTSNTAGGCGDLRQPVKTVTAGGNHAALVAALLHDGGGNPPEGDPPEAVTLSIGGRTFVIHDVGLRMLCPRELFSAQGFPETYIIDPVVDGRQLSKAAQVRLCGNSVCPQVAAAIVAANCADLRRRRRPRYRQRELSGV